MKKLLLRSVFFLSIVALLFLTYPYINTTADRDVPFDEDEPDMPSFLKTNMSKEDFMLLRAENIALLRGIETAKPDSRPKAVAKLEKSELAECAKAFRNKSTGSSDLAIAWTRADSCQRKHFIQRTRHFNRRSSH